MKEIVKNIIENAIENAVKAGDLPSDRFPDIEIEEPKIETHGDFSTNIAMISASVQKMAPRKIAEAILKNLFDPAGIISKKEIAGPGFINFFIAPLFWNTVLININDDPDNKYGASDIGNGKKVQVEFVSANPTGPLHVGHGRGAAVGDSVANILSFCGYDVQREYYINDSGRQIRTLGLSTFLRYKEILGQKIEFPDDCYQGNYITEFAKTIKDQKQDSLLEQDQEDSIAFCAKFSASIILDGIKHDLKDFGVVMDNWFSEQTLYDQGKVDSAIQNLKDRGIIYEQEGAWWFKTSKYGDEKDRVVIRSNGQTTYFASDIAYHLDKFKRGFERVIDVWGADHHGYIPRIKASIEATGKQKDNFNVILVQLVNLLRNGEPVAMSTRAGEFVTLQDVVNEVGTDAARFIFLTRHYESPLDFDLEVAKKKTNDNPVYYVQYVHARISSILRKGEEEYNIDNITCDNESINRLLETEEINIMKALSRYPEVVALSANNMEPHRITFFLMNLASLFHTYYNKHRVLTDDKVLTMGRLYLILAVKKVIKNGLGLLGVSAPDKM